MNETDFPAIAVVVAGPDEEYQQSVLEGIIAASKRALANVSCFAAFGGVLGNSLYDVGEYNIYQLMNLDKFDGIILLTNTVCDLNVRRAIIRRVEEAGIPATILDGGDDTAFYNIRIDNSLAMRQIVQHVLTVHNAKRINYISGPLENPEARARYIAFCDVMAEHGLMVDNDRVFYGTFRPFDGRDAVEELLRSGLDLPDAIVSANDAMALEAIATLEKHGIRVPDDVIVTGFDNTYYAQHHCPALTTVSRPLFDAGYKACEVLLDVIAGRSVSRVQLLSATPVYSESCGCGVRRIGDIQAYKKSTYQMIKRTRSDISLLNRLTSALAETESVETHHRVLGGFLHEMECSQCCVCLCSGWESAFHDVRFGEDNSLASYIVHGYTHLMTAPLIWENGGITSCEAFPADEMLPLPHETGGNISYFLPLHFRDSCLGYYVITNGDFPLSSMVCHSVMMNIGQSLENIRKLLHLNNAIRELDRLYVVDPLTGIYNRNGFIRLADSMFKHCLENGRQLMVTFIDMDGLKLINDNYGHDEGDFALHQLALVISQTAGSECISARFGGDEFIILGVSKNKTDPLVIEANFEKNLAAKNAAIHKPYEISASIGTFTTKVEPGMKLFGLITQADQIMYEQKKRKRSSRYLRKADEQSLNLSDLQKIGSDDT